VTRLAFIDCETTGLDPERHEPYEVAIIVDKVEHHWWLPVELAVADPGALRISRYYERTPDTASLPHEAALQIARVTAGAHLVAAVPSFDAAFIGAFLRQCGCPPAWHYHLVDVEALVAGRLRIPPPWKSDDLSRQIGIEPPGEDDRHSALADARWAKQLYERVMQP
jgi:DNA polymerase III epsilon subunit-like protein